MILREIIKDSCLAALLTAAAAFTACSGSDDAPKGGPESPTEPKNYTMTVEASKGESALARALAAAGDEAETRALSYDGDTKTLSATWGEGEHVVVYANYGSGYALAGSLTPVTTGSATATLSGGVTLTGHPELLLVYIGKREVPSSSSTFSYEGQTGTLYGIAQNYDYASATLPAEGYSIGNNTISASAVSFTNDQAIVRFNMMDENDNPLSVDGLIVSPAAPSIAYGLGYASLPGELTIISSIGASSLYVALRGVTNRTLTLTAKCTLTNNYDTYGYTTHGNVTFERGKYYEITVKMKKCESKELTNVTASDIGWVVGSDGWAYSFKEGIPSDVTARAVIGDVIGGVCYAFALEDATAGATWANAYAAISSWGANKGISGRTWTLFGMDLWSFFLSHNNGNTLLTNAGGTAMSGTYWTSDEDGDNNAYTVNESGSDDSTPKTESHKVRAGIQVITNFHSRGQSPSAGESGDLSP